MRTKMTTLMAARAVVCAAALLVGSFAAEVNAQSPIRDWSLYKTFYFNGTFVFMPIVGIGGTPVAVGAAIPQSMPMLSFYIDKNSYRSEGEKIIFDLARQHAGQTKSRLHTSTVIDCTTRTFQIPTTQVFDGPLITGEADKVTTYMKKPKVSGDFNAEDMAYFCEGPRRSPVP